MPDGVMIEYFPDLIFCGNLTLILAETYIIDQASENDQFCNGFEDVDMDGYDDVMYVWEK